MLGMRGPGSHEGLGSRNGGKGSVLEKIENAYGKLSSLWSLFPKPRL